MTDFPSQEALEVADELMDRGPFRMEWRIVIALALDRFRAAGVEDNKDVGEGSVFSPEHQDTQPSVGRFTPGPWGLNKYGSIGAGAGWHCPIIASIEPFYGVDERYGSHRANARLIAAAPELYLALDALLGWYESDPTSVGALYAANHARQVLAKAVPQTVAGDDAATPNTDSCPKPRAAT